jgi:hypothetical protein
MNEDQIPQEGQLNIELTEEIAEGIYSNLAIITHSNSEFVLDFIKQERRDFSDKAQTLVELISIMHEKLEEKRKYEMLMSENFEDKYYNILRDEAKVHFSIREQIEIHDTTIHIDDHDENYVIISGYATDSLTGMSVQHRVLAKKYSISRKGIEL